MRTASGPPPPSARRPSSIQSDRGVRVCAGMIHTVPYGCMSFLVRHIDPGAEPRLGITGWDYADSFEVRLDSPDDHPADVWLRTALTQAGAPVRRLIQLIHRHVVRFDLDAADRDDF